MSATRPTPKTSPRRSLLPSVVRAALTLPEPPPTEISATSATVSTAHHNAITAAASRLTSTSIRRNGAKGSNRSTVPQWKQDAWDMYDLVGEHRFLADTLANQMAKARLYVGRVVGNDTEEPEPLEDGDHLNDVLAAFGRNAAGRERIIRKAGVNLFITGDLWLVGVHQYLIPSAEVPEDEPLDERGLPYGWELNSETIHDLRWRALSTDELSTTRDGSVKLRLDEMSEAEVEIPLDDLYIIRVWREHPRRGWESDSPTKASLPVLRELVGLTMDISAQVDSRLAGAGILFVPSSAAEAMKNSINTDKDGGADDPFTDALIEAMSTAISDRSSAAALVPLTITVPDNSIDAFRHLAFERPLDEESRELREEAIRRLALGLDAPPELLLGSAGINHWGAWLVQEEVINTHLTPPLSILCDAITTQYLHPVMAALGYDEEEIGEYVVWYDVSHLVVRPNRGSDAQRLYDAGVLSADAYRTALGFEDSDAPQAVADTFDPVVTLALDMISKAPSLLQSVGLTELVAQIRAVAGEDADEVADVVIEATEEGADAVDVVDGGTALPDTQDDDADPFDETEAP